MTDCVEHSCLGTSVNSNAHPFEWQNLPNLVRDIKTAQVIEREEGKLYKDKKQGRCHPGNSYIVILSSHKEFLHQ